MRFSGGLAAGLIVGLSATLSAYPAPKSAFAPSGFGREYETFAYGTLTDTRGLGSLNLLVFGEGRHAREYDYFAEGASANYRALPQVNVLVKAVSNHLRGKDQVVSALELTEGPSYSHRFFRLETGFEFKLPQHLNLQTLAGKDVNGSPANSMEASLAWWPVIYTYYPVGLTGTIAQDDQTHIQAYTLNGSLGFARACGMTWFLTSTAQSFHGGVLPKAEGRLSAGIGAGSSKGFGFRVSGGGGAHGAFADVALFHLFRL